VNHDILDALSQITREKSVDRAMLIETLEVGLASAVRRKYGATADVQVSFANDTGAISIVLRRTVAETIEDPALQMTVEEARAHRRERLGHAARQHGGEPRALAPGEHDDVDGG